LECGEKRARNIVQEVANNGKVNREERWRKQKWGNGAGNATSDKGNIPGGKSSLLKTTTPVLSGALWSYDVSLITVKYLAVTQTASNQT
jgi:hypothetical protein